MYQPVVGAPIPPTRPEIRHANHLLHLVLTLITFGFWSPIWVCVVLLVNNGNSERNRAYQIAQQQYQYDLAAYQQWTWQQQQAWQWQQQNQPQAIAPIEYRGQQ